MSDTFPLLLKLIFIHIFYLYQETWKKLDLNNPYMLLRSNQHIFNESLAGSSMTACGCENGVKEAANCHCF